MVTMRRRRKFLAQHGQRRAVLLLVVLSVLTLFLMLGATYLAVARRARMASKAFADNITASSAAGVTERKLVDDAFLAIVRGTQAGFAPTALQTGDDLLGDKYGHNSAVTGRVADVSTVSSGQALLRLTATGLSPAPTNAAELNGRVITLLMPNLTASTRVLQATGSGTSASIIVAAGPTVSGVVLSNTAVGAAIGASSGNNMVINGREFADTGTNEPYDAFDNANPLLARLFSSEDYDGDGVLSAGEDVNSNGVFDHDEDVNGNAALDPGEDTNNNGVLDTVAEDLDGDGVFDINEDLNGNSVLDSGAVALLAPLYINGEDINNNGVLDAGEDVNGNGMLDPLPGLIDSDADGVGDSQFIDVGLPAFVNQTGVTVYPRAAITVVDLDGRLNFNTHGSQVDVDTIVGGTTAYPLIPGVSPVFPQIPLENLPRGSGAGPADVSLMRSFSPAWDAAFGGAVASAATHSQLAARAYVASGGFQESTRTTIRGGLPGADTATGREIPRTASADGRYGDGAWNSNLSACDQRPGAATVNDTVSHRQDEWWAALDPTIGPTNGFAFSYFDNSNPSRWSSPPDLKGRLRLWADPQTGQPVYYKPFWDDIVSGVPADNEVVDDPYEADLTQTSGGGNDQIYTPGDLEGLLRYFDSDSLKLERRLVQLGEQQASTNRNLFTTESWDTSAIVGTDWADVIATQFTALLTDTTLVAPQRPVDVFAPEVVAGQRMDINRPFHDVNPAEPNDATGTARRQLMAKQLYCLMLAVARANDTSLNITAEYAEMIAQYAVNIVDFRDADSVMTRFNYDPNFSPGSYAWSPTATVWGCERPELIITETLAWHDRRTDDDATGTGSETTTIGASPDNDFDQRRRPRGAFFVELTSPWLSRAKEFVGPGVADVVIGGETCRADPIDSSLVQVGTQDTNGNGTVDAGEDTDFDGTVSDAVASRFGVEARVDLSKTSGTGPSLSPVWRLVSVRSQQQVDGGTALNADPLINATANAGDAVLDPARPGSTAVIDRAFYFTAPGTGVQAALPNRNFWQDAAHAGGPNPKKHQYVVAGTDAPFDFNQYTAAHPQTRVFVGPNGQPGTLTEPLTTASDPYDAMMQHIATNAMITTTYTAPAAGNNYVGSWSTGHDVPLDSITVDEDINDDGSINGGESDSNSNGVADPLPSSVIPTELEVPGLSNNPLLMFNGTHENFAVIHLQRLANPALAWNAASNPYITVDCMPVDLVVVNTNGPGASNNYDEMGNTGTPALAYLAGSHDFYDQVGGAEIGRTVERGGKVALGIGGNVAAMPGPDTNAWNRRVNPAVSSLNDADAFLSLPPTGSRGPLSAYSVVMQNTLPGGQVIHTFGSEDLNNNGIRDYEDVNGNSLLDPGEDVNRNGILDLLVVTEDTDGDSVLDTPPTDLNEEDLDGNGAITVEGDTNGDNVFLTGAPQRFVNLSIHPEPQKSAWLAWNNRPFASVNELALVPWCSPFHLTRAHAADHSADASPVTQVFHHLLGFFETQANQPSYSATPPSPPTTFPWQAITGNNSLLVGYSLLDFLRVPSPYVGLDKEVGGAAALATLGRDVYPLRQVSNYREPGRINVNTISDPRVWRSLFGDIRAFDDPAPAVLNYPDGDRLPIWSPYLFAGSPAFSVRDFFENRLPPPDANNVFNQGFDEDNNGNGVLDTGEDANLNGVLDTHETDINGNGLLDLAEDLNGNGQLDVILRGRDRHALTEADAEQDLDSSGTITGTEDVNGNGVFDPPDDYRNTDIHSAFRYQTLTRLQNLVTVRSNVYAIWVTVGYFNSSGTEISPIKRNRGFYIFDRSIPVAYERGKDHNVRDAILLRRIIQ